MFILAMIVSIIISNIIVQISNIDLMIPEDWHKPHQISTENIFHELKRNYTTIWQGVEIKTNELGLRDKNYPLAKGNNTKRVIVIGDSITFGGLIKQSKSYPEVLETMLNKNSSYFYEVWNAGVSCYNSYEELTELKRLIKYEPDIIIYGFFQNDLKNSCFVFDKETFFKEHKLLNYLDKSILGRISIYKLIQKNIYNNDQRKKQSLFNNKKINPEQNKQALFDMINITKERKIQFIILNIPFIHIKYYSEKEEELINQIKENNETIVIDIIDSYKLAGKEWYKILRALSTDDSHPNNLGHELIANATYEKLSETRFI